MCIRLVAPYIDSGLTLAQLRSRRRSPWPGQHGTLNRRHRRHQYARWRYLLYRDPRSAQPARGAPGSSALVSHLTSCTDHRRPREHGLPAHQTLLRQVEGAFDCHGQLQSADRLTLVQIQPKRIIYFRDGVSGSSPFDTLECTADESHRGSVCPRLCRRGPRDQRCVDLFA